MITKVNPYRFRSKWKGSYSKVSTALLNRVQMLRQLQTRSIFRHKSLTHIHKFLINTKSRSSIIQKSHSRLSKKIMTHNGKKFVSIKITSDHWGHRLGEFVRTTPRGGIIHKNNAKSKKNKAKK